MAERKIMELDIEQVVNDIYSFYSAESGKEISMEVIKDFVETWAFNKFDLYEKMGNKLRVSATVISKDFIAQDSFIEQAQGLKARRRQKDSPSEVDFYAIKFFDYIGRHYSDWQDLTNNTFIGNVWGLEALIRNVFRTSFIVDSFNFADKQALSNKNKLTKAISFYFKHPQAVAEIGADKCQLYSHYLNSFISEIKQTCESGTKETEVVFSIHPYDYVTMSWNTLGWRSCYAPDGEYAKSSFVVMADGSTVVAYTTSSILPNTCHAVVMNNKKVRSMVHFNATFTGVILNTVYPASAGSYYDLMKKALIETGLMESLIKVEESCLTRDTTVSEAMYNDLPRRKEDDKGLEMYLEKDTDSKNWFIGVEGAVCMACGAFLDGNHSDEGISEWYCHSCDPEYYQEDDYNEDYEEESAEESVTWKNHIVPYNLVVIKKGLVLNLTVSVTTSDRVQAHNVALIEMKQMCDWADYSKRYRLILKEYLELGIGDVEYGDRIYNHVDMLYNPDNCED